MTLVTGGIYRKAGFCDRVPLARGIANVDVPVLDSASDMSGVRIKVFEERVKAFEGGVGLWSAEAGNQFPCAIGGITEPAGIGCRVVAGVRLDSSQKSADSAGLPRMDKVALSA